MAKKPKRLHSTLISRKSKTSDHHRLLVNVLKLLEHLSEKRNKFVFKKKKKKLKGILIQFPWGQQIRASILITARGITFCLEKQYPLLKCRKIFSVEIIQPKSHLLVITLTSCNVRSRNFEILQVVWDKNRMRDNEKTKTKINLPKTWSGKDGNETWVT